MVTDHLRELETAAEQYAGLLDTGDLDAAVPACPGWSLRDLTHHLGGIHAWATYAVEHGEPGEETHEGPSEREELAGWYRERASTVLTVLREAGPDGIAWTFGPPYDASFWRRRQAHETRMHLGDARRSQGLDDVWDPDLAWDGVLEVCEMFYPRQVRLSRTEPLPVALRLAPTDVDDTTLVGRGDEITVRGTSQVLLELLWHRRTPPDDVARWFDRALTP